MSVTDLIGTTEAARRLGISRDTLIRRVEEGTVSSLGKLPGRNGALVFRADDIETLANAGAAAVPA